MEKIKKITIQDVLCIFIILCPVLDMASFIFRGTFNSNISPSTFLRPVIPIVIWCIVFFKNKIKWQMALVSIVYAIYGIIHLWIFYKIKVGYSYGGVLNELQYIVNYSFGIMNLFLFTFLFWKKDNEKLKNSILIAFGIYIISIYISIITKTSSTTYIEGTGFKGWYESGNSLCTILCVCLCIILPMLKDKKKIIIVAILGLLSGIFLTVLVGTRTGMLGFALIVILYILSECFVAFISKFKIDKKIIFALIALMILIASLIFVCGSKTFERRQHLKQVQVSVDIEAGEKQYLSGDVTDLKNQIEDGKVSKEDLSEEMQKAILNLYQYAKNTNMSNNNLRKQQLIYNIYLVGEQKNIPLLLFGNGYKAQFRELVMEMEVPAMILNFGLIGFSLYFVPFLAISMYGLYIAFKNIKRLNTNYIMYLGGSWLAIFLSFLSGYTYFNSSSMIIVIAVNVLLINEILKIKENKS